MKRRARWRGVLTVSAAFVALLAGGGVWVTRSHDTLTVARPAPVPAQFHLGLGVETHFRVSFAEDRRVSSAVVTNEGVNARSGYYPLDGSDSDRNYPNPLLLPAGTQMEFDAVVIPACDGQESGDVVLQVSSRRPNGNQVTDRFRAVNVDQFRRVTREYCARGTGVHIQGELSAAWPGGRARFLLFVTNPTAHPVTVRSHAYHRGGGQWQPASIVVPSRTSRKLTINARNVLDRSCPRSAPWATHHLTVDGRPVSLNQQENACE